MAGVLDRLRTMGMDFWLALLAGLISVLSLVQAGSCMSARRVGRKVIRASFASTPGVSRAEVKQLKEYEEISKSGHFGKQKPPPKLRLFGVLGDTALIGQSDRDAKPYSTGASLPGGKKLVEIHLDSVVVEKEGKKETLEVFPEFPPPGGKGSGRPSTGGPPRHSRPGMSPQGITEEMPGEVRQQFMEMKMRGASGEIPEELKRRLMEE